MSSRPNGDMAESHAVAAPARRAPLLRVLLAEDDAARCALLVTALRESGYDVTAVTSGEAALTAFAREAVPLVVLDTELPGVGGIEVCRRIRALDPSRAAFVLVYSRGDSLEPLLAALDAGADDYMLQPTTAAHLRARLALAERRLDQDAARRAAEAEAARARYLAGVGEMAIALQHEINNPLAAILAHAELMAMDAAESGTPDDSLQTILEQARRIAAVVRKLSSLRNPTSVEYVPGKRMVHLHEEG